MKKAPLASSSDGEEFLSCLGEGYKTYRQESGPFDRFLPHIEARNLKIKALPQAQGNYREYDATDTVNQS